MNKKFFILFFLALVLCFLPVVLRLSHNISTIPGVEPYYHLCAVNGCLNKQVSVLQEPFNLVIALSEHLGYSFLLFLPSIFGFLSFVLFWFLVKKLKFDNFWFSFAFVLSPVFVTFSFLAFRYGFVLCLILAGLVFMLSKRFKWLGVLFFVFSGLSGLVSFVASVFFVLALLILRPELRKWCFFILAFLFLILLADFFPPSVSYSFGFSEFFSDLGGLFGIGVFSLILSVMGVVFVWNMKSKFFYLFALTLLFFVIAYFFPPLLVFGNVVLACLSGVALSWLFKRRWKLKFLRSVSLLLIVCGLLFSSLSHVFVVADMMPANSFFDALGFGKGVVLSHESYGFWIEFAGHPVVLDPLWKLLPDGQSLINNIDLAFGSSDLRIVKRILKEYNVSFVLVTPQMMQGLVWEKQGQGMAFLLENAKIFNKVFSKDGVVVWEVLNEE